MKGLYLGIIGGISLVVFVALGFVFVFGENSLDVLNGKNFDIEASSEGSGNSPTVDSGVDNEKESLVDSDSTSNGGGGSGGSSTGEENNDFACNNLEPVQYSLRNFVEDISCLESIDNKCVAVAVNCSVEVYNLDHIVGGVFGIRYSVVSGEDVFDEEIDEKDIAVGDMDILKSEFLLNGSFDIEDLECSIDMDSVPRKCV